MVHRHGFSLGTFMACLAPTTTSGSSQAAGDSGGVPWWVWLIIGLVVLALILWWWLRSRRGGETTPEVTLPTKAAPAAEPAPATPDDLKRIEGIGPKISTVLQAAGITTFAHLAETDVDRLRQILSEANLSALADPGTWPEQAALAASGKWDEFEAMLGQLKGGRRT